jgi:uncharacterized membrane protein YkoI
MRKATKPRKIDSKEAKKIARELLETSHTVNAVNAKLKKGVWQVKAVVDLSHDQIKELSIDSKTGKVLRFRTSS